MGAEAGVRAQLSGNRRYQVVQRSELPEGAFGGYLARFARVLQQVELTLDDNG